MATPQESGRTIPQEHAGVLSRARRVVTSPIGLAREIHQVASNMDRLSRENMGTAKTVAAEVAIIIPPHLVIAGLATGNALLFAGGTFLTISEVCSVVYARVYDPEAYRALLDPEAKL